MKRTLISLIVIGLIALTAGAGTYAIFSDTETSTGNTFTAGTLDMEIGYCVWEFPFDDMKPGRSTGDQKIELTMATGSNPADHIEIDIDTHDFVDSNVESGGTNTADDFKKQIEVDTLTYMDDITVDLLTLVDDSADGNAGFISLYDVEAYGVFDDLSTFDLGQGSLTVCLSLPADLPDTNDDKYQGDSIQIDFEFGAAQVAGQDVLSD